MSTATKSTSTNTNTASSKKASTAESTNEPKKAKKTMSTDTTGSAPKAKAIKSAKKSKSPAKDTIDDTASGTSNPVVLTPTPLTTVTALATAAAASPAPSTTNGASAFVQPPPASALIPPVPAGAVAPLPGTYRSVIPKAGEAALLPAVVGELERFSNFSTIFAALGLSGEQVIQAFSVTSQWTTMRSASDQWDTFAQTQEGVCWEALRPIIAKLKIVFPVAVAANPSLTAAYPNFAAFLAVKSGIARKAASTKKANKVAIAEGKAPTHGAVGKARVKATDKAIVAASKGAAPVSIVPTPTAPVTTASASASILAPSTAASH